MTKKAKKKNKRVLENELPENILPQNILPIGERVEENKNIYIAQAVYKEIHKFTKNKTTNESGGMLVGTVIEEFGKTNIVISGFVEAKFCEATPTTLKFTHETWEYVHSEHEKRYADQKIIGWQHTHPNYGIFLSNYDLFIQENFFNLPFQVAYVIDPIQNLRGFFQWKNGRIEELRGYYIYDDVGKPIKIEQTKAKKEAPTPAKTSRIASILIALLCAATLVLSLFTVSLNNKYQKQLEKHEEILGTLSSQQEEIQNQKDQIEGQGTEIDHQNEVIQSQADAIAQLQELLENGVLDDSGNTTGADLLEMLENPELISKLGALLEQKPENVATFRAYTVAAGDNLYQICAANNLDYGSYCDIILAINGIKDPDQIDIGQKILLPVIE